MIDLSASRAVRFLLFCCLSLVCALLISPAARAQSQIATSITITAPAAAPSIADPAVSFQVLDQFGAPFDADNATVFTATASGGGSFAATATVGQKLSGSGGTALLRVAGGQATIAVTVPTPQIICVGATDSQGLGLAMPACASMEFYNPRGSGGSIVFVKTDQKNFTVNGRMVHAGGNFGGDLGDDVAVVGHDSGIVSTRPISDDGIIGSAFSSHNFGTGSYFGINHADFDGNGCNDLVVIDYGTPALKLALGNCNGTFAPYTSYASTTSPIGLAVGDLNGDNNTDIVIGGESSLQIKVYLGDGNGTFTPLAAVGSGVQTRWIDIGHLNGDAYPDLAIAGFAGNIAVMMGNGNGTFSSPVIYTLSGAMAVIRIADFNHDSCNDLVAANYNMNNLTTYTGNCSGSFIKSLTLGAGSMPHGLVVGDYNFDSKMDIVASARSTPTIAVYAGKGDGTFETRQDVVATSSFSLDQGDFDHDGRIDLAVANNGTGDVAIMMNRTISSEMDTDQDALSDRAEVYYGTDPNDVDTDGDGVGDGEEMLDYHSNPLAADTDGDLMPDGWEIASGLDPLSADAGLNPDGDGLTNLQEYQAGTMAKDSDTDNDLAPDGPTDCNPLDPNVWASCAGCVDADSDGGWIGCDAYATHLGPDCNDTNPNAWNTCATCVDADGDGRFRLCNTYTGISGPDCSDANRNAWDSCATCIDADGDGWYKVCNSYVGINGPDCSDANRNIWQSCASCVDADGDGWFDGCDAYVTISGPDCAPAAAAHWNDCGSCTDADADLRGAGCNLGSDCDDGRVYTWNTCATCVDADGDGRHYLCNNYIGISGPDCSDANLNAWDSCATCIDADADGWFKVCNSYVGINGPDCSDANINAWNTCATCIDADADNWYSGCDAYVTISGPDCAPAVAAHWNDCGICADVDGDGRGAGCNLGADCDDGRAYTWDTCATCVDLDGDNSYGMCNSQPPAPLTTVAIGAGIGAWEYPLNTYFHDARTEVIYLASEIGSGGLISSLALDVTAAPGQVMNNFTIRLKHTSLSAFGSASWEPASGWTTVYQANAIRGTTGWRTFTFSTPFNFNGTSNLLVDISFNNTSYTAAGRVRFTGGTTPMAIVGWSDSLHGDPTAWTGTSSPTPSLSQNRPNIRFATQSNIVDCNDADPNAWSTCATCIDADGDGWHGFCNLYNGIQGPDCSDANPNVWDACATCVDADADGWHVGCNQYQTINGPDCGDSNRNAWVSCATCADADGDGWYGTCDDYQFAETRVIGAGTSISNLPLATGYHDSRVESIYPAGTIGAAGTITALALNVVTVPGQAMNNFTIRLKHTAANVHSPAAWEGPASGFQTVYQAVEQPGLVGWHNFALTTPFAFNGSGNLMVDLSFNNSSYSTSGQLYYTPGSAGASVYARNNSTYGDPLTWTGPSSPTPTLSSTLPNLRLTVLVTRHGPDCDDANPNAWATCATCVDADADGWYVLCDAYTGISGPDCNDANWNTWATCATCADNDGDGWYTLCDAYTGISGPDCADANWNAWTTCATCVDVDNDGWYGACDRYDGIQGPDCGDQNPNAWTQCATCADTDGDGWYGACDRYDGINGPDCGDQNPNAWTSCATCVDVDADNSYIGCDRYFNVSGPDCSDADPNSWTTCATCVDVDADGWYAACDRYLTVSGPDCSDYSPNTWDSCATCHDFDSDGRYQACNQYLTVAGPDCSDYNPRAWDACASCVDADGDGWLWLCDSYAGSNGPDCSDDNPNAWLACDSCADHDGDGSQGICDRNYNYSMAQVGAGIDSWAFPLATSSKKARTQAIYLANEIGPAGLITALALDVNTVPLPALQNFTIRLKPTGLASYSAAEWDGPDSGWVTVYQSVENVSSPGQWSFAFTTPFNYDGVSNVMVDFSFNNPFPSLAGIVRATATAAARTAILGDNDSYGEPLAWIGASPEPTLLSGIPNARFTVAQPGDPTDCDDALAAVYPGAAEACDALDNQCPGDAGYGTVDEGCAPDSDGDGLSDGLEVVIGTDPNDADSDDDGLNDGEEYNTRGTDPLGWDSDGDGLPDGFEVSHLEGHPVGLTLDPLGPADGALDFDGDGNGNADEFYNGSSPWSADPTGAAGCYFWGEADGDGFVSPSDIAAMTGMFRGIDWSYNLVLPPTSETQDMDMDGFLSPTDQSVLAGMVQGLTLNPLGSRPEETLVIEPMGVATVAVGDTVRLAVALRNTAGLHTPGFGVVFALAASSTGTATIFGGDGGSGAGRYDVTGTVVSGARSEVVVRVDSAGAVVVEVSVPECGEGGVGRWAPALSLAAPLVINP